LHWGFGNPVAADHSRVSEWRECLDFDAERYASIFDEATRAGPEPDDIRTHLFGNARLSDAGQARAAGIVHVVIQAHLPAAGETSHWWNG
jgi:ATP-dependent Clp protease protease subunit